MVVRTDEVDRQTAANKTPLQVLLLACSVGLLAGCLTAAEDRNGTDQRLLFLDIKAGRVLIASPHAGGEQQGVRETEQRDTPTVLVEDAGPAPDGIAIDLQGGYLYWTTMGHAKKNDGAVRRARLDGSGVETVVATGNTHTPKQMQLDLTDQKLYWSDREGMKVMRANLDGTNIETLVTIATGDQARQDAANWAVGLALDLEGRLLYWSQKGGTDAHLGSIRRVAMDMAANETPEQRKIEVLFDQLPEPIDLAIDSEAGLLYWTDRGDNTVNRAALDPPADATAISRLDREILVTGLKEAIGITLDIPNQKMYYTDLAGNIGVANLDGSESKALYVGQGVATGITITEWPTSQKE